MSRLGESLGQATIARIEKRSINRVAIDDVFALAAALGVSPLTLMTPAGRLDGVRVAEKIIAPAVIARRWIQGYRELPNQDKNFYLEQLPEEFRTLNNDPLLGALNRDVNALIDGCQGDDIDLEAAHFHVELVRAHMNSLELSLRRMKAKKKGKK